VERTELAAWLRLALTPGIGNETARALLDAFGSAEAIFTQTPAALAEMGSARLARAIAAPPANLAAQTQTTLDWLAAGDDRHVAVLGDAAYPRALRDIADPPLMLYMLGARAARARAATETIADELPMIGIVGSRNPTPQGEINARAFAKAFAERGLCVVSGMALGIDGAAHDGALLGGGETIAVVGTGLDRVYPKKHLALAHRIAASGMIVSEFALGTPPLTANFPRRNRIISGMSRGVLVVEAALKSGSLITARLANEQGREVFAIPGSIHAPQSRGCHALIKQGAKLVETAEDVLEELRFPALARTSAEAGDSGDSEDGDASGADSESGEGDSPLLAAMGFDATSLDALQARTGVPTPELQARLLELELDGVVARLPGGYFQRMGRA
jgi:DNA processing protein